MIAPPRRARGEAERDERERDRAGVGEHVRRVGEQRERVGEDADDDLDDHEAEDQRERDRRASGWSASAETHGVAVRLHA